ncbi:hypothetical protein [Methylotenera versatilis]|uniref:hypothetical protein n=1 Tax=Methylotenera versatilis TaxID=1055487 RepID=UPI000646044C|nr:hypothetical protein [Methylotenera versatilis]
MKKLFTLVALLTVATTANANLIQNGSFEETIQANGTWGIYNSINGWSTTNGAGIEIRNNVEGAASNGVNFVELDSNNNSAMIQTITTSAGSLYELLFDYSPRVNQPATTNGISVFWNGTLLAEITGTGGVSNSWVTQQFFVTGTGNDVLKFAATGTSDSLGGNIDYVQLNAVPVPAAAWLFASALCLFGFARRNSI